MRRSSWSRCPKRRWPACRTPAFLGALAALALSMSVEASRAAESDPVTADALFERGRALMAEGRTEDACATFAESNRIDPATGTLLNLAACNEALGKTATAWTQFRAAEVAARSDGRTDRVDFARAHQATLEARLAYLTLRVAGGVPETRSSAALQVRLDDQAIEAARWNVAIPIDPGAHTVTAQVPGGEVRAFAVSVPNQAATLAIDIELEPRNTARSGGEAGDGAGPRPLRTLAYVAGGAGAAALGTSIVFGARAFSRWDERNRRCPMDACTTPAGQRAQRSAENAARNANIAFGVGLVALASGVGLYFLSADPAASDSPAASGDAASTDVERGVSWAWFPALGAQELGLVAEGRW